MKKLIAFVMALAFTVSGVHAAEHDLELDVIKSLGIMRGDENGNMMLSKNVTRAEFATMAASASAFRDTVGGRAYVSMFSDVKSEHWASGYIKLAVDNGWFAGYIDGTFRPDNTIKNEEGIAVALRIMGYDFSKSVGVYPNVQLDKAREIGLTKNLKGIRGTYLSREQCKTLFYNMLICKDGSGSLYADRLNIPIANGEVDYLDLVYKDLEGPFIYNGIDNTRIANTSIIKAGRPISHLNKSDVYYQNKALGKTFVFDEKVVGRVDKILPDTINPKQVVINGTNYDLISYEAKLQFSTLGGYKTGDSVAVLLGMEDKKIVGVIDANDVNMTYYGILLSKENSSTEINNKKEYFTKITVLCTDGVTRDFQVDSDSTKLGKFVEIRLSDKGAKLSSMPSRSLAGKVKTSGIGDKEFAANINVQEYYENAPLENRLKNITLSEILGAKLSSSDVLFYDKDENGDISSIVLNDVTGNARKYGMLYKTNAQENTGEWSVNTSTYYCLFDGLDATVSSEGFSKRISIGGVEVYSSLDGDELIRELEKTKMYKVSGDVGYTEDGDITISKDVQIYLKDAYEYRLVNIENVNSDDYSMYAYYNKSKVGKRVRIIVANKKIK